MRILFVAPYLPSLIRVRPFNFIRALAEAGHSIVLLGLAEREEPGMASLKNWCERIEPIPLRRTSAYANSIMMMFGEGSLQAAYCRSPEMEERVREILAAEKFDLVHVDHLRAAQYVPARIEPLKFIDAVDCITSLYDQFRRNLPRGLGRLKSRMEWRRLKDYEPRVLNQFDQVIVTCERESAALREIGVRSPVAVVGNGVDFQYFEPHPELKPFDHPTIVFSGKMSYAANSDAALYFAEEVFPRVKEAVPAARFLIVGSYPGRKVRALQQIAGVEVTGGVDDLRDYIARAHVAVSPMRIAVGVQNKVLEAMALGVPVVASSKACDGIQAQDEQEILSANRPEDMANAVIRVLQDPELAQRLGRHGLEYVRENHDWNRKAKQLESIYVRGLDGEGVSDQSFTDAA